MLTARQQETFDIVVGEFRDTGRAPVLQTIADKMGISVAGVVFKLRALEAHGFIRRKPGVRRRIELVRTHRDAA